MERAGYDEATGSVYDEYEVMGPTREKIVDGELNPHNVLEGGSAWKSIDEEREKRERDLMVLAEGADERLLMEEWIRTCKVDA